MECMFLTSATVYVFEMYGVKGKETANFWKEKEDIEKKPYNITLRSRSWSLYDGSCVHAPEWNRRLLIPEGYLFRNGFW